MHSAYWCAPDNLYVRDRQTTLLYKEVAEFPRRPWRQQPADASELFHPGLVETTPDPPLLGVSQALRFPETGRQDRTGFRLPMAVRT